MSLNRSSLTSPLTVLATATLALGVAVKTLPLQTARPNEAERRVFSITGSQDVEARLWQDPVSVVDAEIARRIADRFRDAARPQSRESRIKALRDEDLLNEEHLLAELEGKLSTRGRSALAVLFTGSGGSEDVEYRRRTRYAVLSGLFESGFVPDDSTHLGYVWTEPPQQPTGPHQTEPSRQSRSRHDTDRARNRLQHAIPYEWFRCEEQSRCSHDGRSHVLLLWLEEEAFQHEPVAKLRGLARHLRVEGLTVIGPGYAESLRSIEEDLTRSPNQQVPALKRAGFSKDLDVREAIDPALHIFSPWVTTPTASTEPITIERHNARIVRTISDDSYVVQTIIDELKLRALLRSRTADSRAGDAADTLPAKILQWMLPATQSTKRLASALWSEHCKAVSSIGLTIGCSADARSSVAVTQHDMDRIKQVTTGSTASPSQMPNDRQGSFNRDAYLLIYERDTAYSRQLRSQLEDAIRAACGDCGIYSVGYLRGLDGLAADRTRDSDEARGEQSRTRAGTSEERVDQRSVQDRAFGRTQFDYLRRAPDPVDPPVDLNGVPSNRHFRAVGILGNDVYDKLVILRALRDRFSQATFFTTDLDARMLQSDQVQWTRNLLAVSGFGLSLNPGLQGSTPPFRDSYQTSTFYATLRAASGKPAPGYFTHARAVAPSLEPATGPIGPAQELTTRVFEIGRTRAIALDGNGAKVPCKDLGSCNDIQSLAEKNYPETPKRASALWPTVALVGIAVLMTWRWPWSLSLGLGRLSRIFRQLRGHAPDPSSPSGRAGFDVRSENRDDDHRELRRTLAGASGVFLIGITSYLGYLIWQRIEFESSYGLGEPFLWTEGVSTWPPQLIRIVSIGLCVYFVVRSWRAVHDLIADIDTVDPNFSLRPRETEGTEQNDASAHDSGREKCKRWFMLAGLGPFVCFGKPPSPLSRRIQDRFTLTGSGCVDSLALWREYRERVNWHNRAPWILTMSAVLFLTQFPTAAVLDDATPFLPARGHTARAVDTLLFNAHLLVSIYLVVTVVYIIGTTRRFIQRLSAQESRWPEHVLRRTADRDRLDRSIIGDWVDFRIVTKMTAAVSPIIYWPFITLVLIYVVRSPIFDAITFPISLQVLAGACLGYATYAAIGLRRSAEDARTNALQDYERTLMRLRARSDAGENGKSENAAKQIEQLMERIRSETAGAFSPLSQQPFVRALLIPLGSFGTISIAEYLTLMNL